MSTQGAEHQDRPSETERVLINRAEQGAVGVERFDDRAEVIELIERPRTRTGHQKQHDR